MAKFADLFPDSAMIAALGDDVTYVYSGGGSVPIKAIVDYDVERIGDDGYTNELQTEVELLLSDLNREPERGDKIIDGDKTLIVDAPITNDGVYMRLAVR